LNAVISEAAQLSLICRNWPDTCEAVNVCGSMG
jgi:hypothetical protein